MQSVPFRRDPLLYGNRCPWACLLGPDRQGPRRSVLAALSSQTHKPVGAERIPSLLGELEVSACPGPPSTHRPLCVTGTPGGRAPAKSARVLVKPCSVAPPLPFRGFSFSPRVCNSHDDFPLITLGFSCSAVHPRASPPPVPLPRLRPMLLTTSSICRIPSWAWSHLHLLRLWEVGSQGLIIPPPP